MRYWKAAVVIVAFRRILESHFVFRVDFFFFTSPPYVHLICAADGQVMAAEWSKYDIQCNTIGPTIVLTDMGAKAWG